MKIRNKSISTYLRTLRAILFLSVVAITGAVCVGPMAAHAVIINFNAGSSADIGNGWIEKAPGAFSLVTGRAQKNAVGTAYRDNLVYRPSGDDVANVEASVEFRLSSVAPGYPSVFVRGQAYSIGLADNMDAYLLFVDISANQAVLGRQTGDDLWTPLATITLSEALLAVIDYRLTLSAVGTDPVVLDAFVERNSGGGWATIGQAIGINDTAVDRIIRPGTVGFSGNDTEANFSYANFDRTVLPPPVPVITGFNPVSVQEGSPAFTLTVTGQNFDPNSVVRWNGASRPTTYIAGNELEVDITAADITTAQMPAITVNTPGSGASSPETYFVLEPTATFFYDGFNRADDPGIGNNWTEKEPNAFSLVSNVITSIDTIPIDYRDTLVTRPVAEDTLDVEVSAEFILIPNGEFPQVHGRIQRALLTPSQNESYIFFIPFGQNVDADYSRAIIAIQPDMGGVLDCYIRDVYFPAPLEVGDRIRLRFRIDGINPVELTGTVEQFVNGGWNQIARLTVNHDATTTTDLYCGGLAGSPAPGFPVPAPITTDGAVGFAKNYTPGDLVDNFYWLITPSNIAGSSIGGAGGGGGGGSSGGGGGGGGGGCFIATTLDASPNTAGMAAIFTLAGLMAGLGVYLRRK
jgi:hypothetical protein